MRAFLQDDWRERTSFLSMLHCGLVIPCLALALAAFAAGGGGGGGEAELYGAIAGLALITEQVGPHDLRPGMVWDTKHRKCFMRHSRVLSDPDLTEYGYALAKADRYQEPIDILDVLDNLNIPRSPNYCGYATREHAYPVQVKVRQSWSWRESRGVVAAVFGVVSGLFGAWRSCARDERVRGSHALLS
jgi:hypothetical protein